MERIFMGINPGYPLDGMETEATVESINLVVDETGIAFDGIINGIWMFSMPAPISKIDLKTALNICGGFMGTIEFLEIKEGD